MLPLEVPAGTTVDGLITELIPQLHASLVRETAGEAHVAWVEARGHKTWTATIRGAAMTLVEGEEGKPSIWVSFEKRVADAFLADWTGPKKYLPKAMPATAGGGLTLLSDPRVMKRLAMASGIIELAVRDFEGERIAMTAGFGDAAKRGIDVDDPDVVVETGLATLMALAEGRLAPDDALSNGDVKTKGNRFLAMQLALALAPFFPATR